MKNWTMILLMALSCFMFYGCYTLTPQHPTKSKSEYSMDKAECEKMARSFGFDSQDDFTVIEEIQYTRQCLKSRGWTYLKKSE